MQLAPPLESHSFVKSARAAGETVIHATAATNIENPSTTPAAPRTPFPRFLKNSTDIINYKPYPRLLPPIPRLKTDTPR